MKRKLQFVLQRIHKDSSDSKALKAIGDSTDPIFKEMVRAVDLSAPLLRGPQQAQQGVSRILCSIPCGRAL